MSEVAAQTEAAALPPGVTTVADDDALAGLQRIDHIIVLMLENRSFDHMLGFLALDQKRTDIEAQPATATNEANGVDSDALLQVNALMGKRSGIELIATQSDILQYLRADRM